MRKRRFGSKKPKHSGEMELQITSMADIFTILLVFLLKSYSSGINVTPSIGMILPDAQASESVIEALKIEVSQTGVQIEGKPVSTLLKFAFDSTDLETNGSSRSLTAALELERKRQLLIAQHNSDVKVDAKVVIVADQRAPYSTLKTVLASAAVQGYTDFKLAVIKGE